MPLRGSPASRRPVEAGTARPDDHTQLQAICRTNRPYGGAKKHGLIVDYLGVSDDVAQAIQFDEEGITRVVTNISELIAKLPELSRRLAVWSWKWCRRYALDRWPRGRAAKNGQGAYIIFRADAATAVGMYEHQAKTTVRVDTVSWR